MKIFRILGCVLPVIMCSCQSHVIHVVPVPVKPKPDVVVVKPKPKPKPKPAPRPSPAPEPVSPENFKNVEGIR